jgi:DNA polymerase
MNVKKLNELKNECLNCDKCKIGCKKIGTNEAEHDSNVFSNMNTDASVMVIGQNPGYNEVCQGTPFIGRSGEFFDKALNDVLSVGREKLYISNCVKCFTPENRGPTSKEVENCRCFLDKEIEIVNPALIIVLGNYSMERVAGMCGMQKHHGTEIISPRYQCPVMPLYHPSPLNMNKKEKRELFYTALKSVKKYL